MLSVFALTALGACAAAPPADHQGGRTDDEGLVLVRGGAFEMGDWLGTGTADERPVHEVMVSDFFLGRREVTVRQFRAFVAATGYRTSAEKAGWVLDINPAMRTFEKKEGISWKNPGFEQGNNNPVVWVNWNDAREYTRWLARETGRPYRLPTEAEWEYAAREGGRELRWAGTADQGRVGDYAWFAENSGGRPHAVGGKMPNALGLFDMSGNVWEWCLDWRGVYRAGGEPFVDPRGSSKSPYRALRGGSWRVDGNVIRTTYRNGYKPDYAHSSIGFRVALPAGEK
jgi:formylglycine-generating enzyme required for sulfatase activity